jgi:hypothetical protein
VTRLASGWLPIQDRLLVVITPTTDATYYLEAEGQFTHSTGRYSLALQEYVGRGTALLENIA